MSLQRQLFSKEGSGNPSQAGAGLYSNTENVQYEVKKPPRTIRRAETQQSIFVEVY